MQALLLADLEQLSEEEAIASLASDFEIARDAMGIGKLLIAYVSVGSWGCDSSAFVLYEGADGKLYEVHGGHCSCYGFDGQWEPSPSSVTYLQSVNFAFTTGGYDDDDAKNRAAVKARIAELSQ